MIEEIQTFKSSGKFLITAEYLILKGAVGLALPLKFGQTLSIEKNQTRNLVWTSETFGKKWFNAKFDIHLLILSATNDEEIAKSLQNILQVCRIMNKEFLPEGVNALINADFNLAWGLGSSSTLIYNIAQWAKVDPYILLEKTFGGSGYDIACAGAKGPITYQLNNTERTVKDVDFHPSFNENIFFVYLGKKMNSRTGMSYFREKAQFGEKEIKRINEITEGIISAKTRPEFENLLNEHEEIMSNILQLPTIKKSNFSNYPYTVKSMGAWGGDFVLVTGDNFEEVKKYFNSKGLDTVIPYNEIVLS